MSQVSLAELNPFVRYVRRLSIRKGDYPSFIVPCDCRLFYVERGKGTMHYRDRSVRLSHGVLLVWQSGTPYRMESAGADAPIEFLAVNYDLTRAHADRSIPIPPQPLSAFRPAALLEAPICPELALHAGPLVLEEAYFAEPMLREMLYEFERHMLMSDEYLSSLMRCLLSLAIRRAHSERGDARLQPVLDYIHLHYREQMSNRQLGDLFGFHPNTLSRMMLASTGQTLHQYLLSCRLQKAVALIEENRLPLQLICEEVGIPDPGYFSKLFRKKLGCAPSAFMRRKA